MSVLCPQLTGRAPGFYRGGGKPLGKDKRWRQGGNDDDDDDHDDNNFKSSRTDDTSRPTTDAATAFLPTSFLLAKSILQTGLGFTIALYVLNQKHMLPRQLSSFVSHALFWPTLPVTVSRRIGAWITVVDDTVVMGGAPFAFANFPEKLFENCGVRGVVNLCEEYKGPAHRYAQLGMRQLYLPTTDHFEPSVSDMKRAVAFISEHEAKGQRVYVHCRAGHGRSAAVVLAWLIHKRRPRSSVALQRLNDDLCRLRNVRTNLWKQRNIRDFQRSLVKVTDDTCLDDAEEIDDQRRESSI